MNCLEAILSKSNDSKKFVFYNFKYPKALYKCFLKTIDVKLVITESLGMKLQIPLLKKLAAVEPILIMVM